MNKTELISINGMTKKYPGVVALNNVDFVLNNQEVRALVGENGAGKSTLIKSMMGIEHPEEGEIYIDGENVRIENPQDAAKNGIAAVFQELSLVPDLSVGENVFLNKEGRAAKFYLNRNKMFRKTQSIIEQYNIDGLRPTDVVAHLAPAKKQLAEIVKAIANQPKILILDEPTSSLTTKETQLLFNIINTLRDKGSSIIYISHRMNELKEIADSVTALRDGKNSGNAKMSDVSMNDIVKMMVGRDVELYSERQERDIDRTEQNKVLSVKKIYIKGRFENVSFELYKGEILGIAGLVGSGRSELMNIVFGIDQADSGEIFIDGKNVTIRNVQDALKNGIGMVPESRHQQGLVLKHSIADNIALPKIRDFQKKLFFSYKQQRQFALEMIKKYSIKTESPYKLASQLSGGNQQKVVIAKWMATNPKILIIDEPTAGIDVHAKAEIHRLIKKMTENGVSVIMISSEMPELINHSDRIIIMNDSKVLGSFLDVDQEMIMSVIMEDKNKATSKENV